MFTSRVLTLVALMEITLPSRTVRLCDGGYVYWGTDKYSCFDVDFGTVKSAETFEEKTGDEAPGGKLTFLPPSTAAATSLSNPAYQGCRMRFWLGEVDPMTGHIIGTPELTADLAIDTVSLKSGKGVREVDIEFESSAKRLFLVMRGQALNDRFHQQCFPGELGMANATGMPRSTAWGAANPT
ncbi:hypothetical protein K9B33_20880 [Sphingobium sp. 3R8]|uniref:hypothetical protein n=1 Tax=Sphingobium sp. 3R8 TaxID=2874921 RepID=UPI001CCC49EE|nr:hypothetical protein [Sphingobium sp. 3R8]MBZ9649993.1 hypothetical protein [Sphingobium sp. 3R8]